MERRTRIGLYGGTFDPVHVGHLAVAKGLASLFRLDEVLLIPAYVAPHKREARVTSAFHRHAMLVLATHTEPALRVSLAELNAPERPYTVDTLSRLRESMGDEPQLFFVMGADAWSEITSWRDWERMLSLSNQIVVTRPGYLWSTNHIPPAISEKVVDLRECDEMKASSEIEADDGPRIYLTDAVNMNVSSTMIRDAIREGRDADWQELVTQPVAEYIRRYGLYGEA